MNTPRYPVFIEVRTTAALRDKIADEYPEHTYTNPHQPEVLLDTINIETDEDVETLRKTLNMPSDEFDRLENVNDICGCGTFILFY
tara:strand:+ start:938 stop:1195 length:258 start_codon:yes stop_codon:yes gene_type:complete